MWSSASNDAVVGEKFLLNSKPSMRAIAWMGSFIVMYAVSLVALSIEMTFAMNLSGFSIIVAVIMNTLAAASTGYLSRGLIAHAQPRAHWEWVWSVSNLLVPALLLLATRGSLGAPRKSDS